MTAHDDAKRALLKAQVHTQLVQAGVLKLAAHYKGDVAAVAVQARYEDQFRNLLTQLEAQGSQRNLGVGGKVELRAPGGNTGTIQGWASTPDLDLAGHEVVNGAFSDAIRKRGLRGPTAIKLLLDHDWTKPAGVITTLEYRSFGGKSGKGGLWLEATLDLNIEYVRDRYSVMQKLGGYNFSVGFMREDYELTERGVLEVRRGDLFEVSLVAFPANEGATVELSASTSDAVADGLASMLAKLRGVNAHIQRTIV
jgi:HK97 family phage prohead protease